VTLSQGTTLQPLRATVRATEAASTGEAAKPELRRGLRLADAACRCLRLAGRIHYLTAVRPATIIDMMSLILGCGRRAGGGGIVKVRILRYKALKFWTAPAAQRLSPAMVT
jgi:hypothetical protein